MIERTSDKKITRDTVRYVADLARISLGEEETDIFREHLEQILKYVEQLEEVDTENVIPTTHVLSSMKNIFREDIPAPSISPEEALSNAPDKADGFFKVPRVIKER